MAIAKVQSKQVATGSGATSATATGYAYASTTGAGNLLVLIVRVLADWSSGGSLAPTINTPSTAGFTWTNAVSADYTDATNQQAERCSIYYIANASAMASTLSTSVTATRSGASSVGVSFSAYEFSGVQTSSPFDTYANVNNNTSAPLNAGTLNTAGIALVIAACVSESNSTTGAGFTSGAVAKEQYALNVAQSSAVATTFAGANVIGGAAACDFLASSSSGASASPAGVTATSSVHTPTTTASSQAAPAGVSATSSVGAASATAANAGSAAPAGVSASSSVHAPYATADCSATPLGVSVQSAVGFVLVQKFGGINIGTAVAGSSLMPSAVNATYFYFRATGYLIPQVTGKYTIGCNYSGGCNLYVGPRQIISDLASNHTANTGTAYVNADIILLTAGVIYPIIIEWQNSTGSPYELQLLWTPFNEPTQVIFQDFLSDSYGPVTGTLSASWWNGTKSLWYPTGSATVDLTNQSLPNTPLNSNGQLASQLKSNQISATGAFTGANPLTQSSTSKTINVAASTIVFGSNSVTYSAGTVTPANYGLHYVYADDPTFAGGAVTYVATTNPLDIYSNDGRLYFGSIQIVASGISAPAISSVSPVTGVSGTSVTITGTNFGATQSTSTVAIGGVAVATYSSWSANSIVVLVPVTAATGSIVVTVGGYVSNGAAFTVSGTGGSGGGGGGGGGRKLN